MYYMKKSEIGILAVLVITITIMLFNITRSATQNNKNESIIADIISTSEILKENETIKIDVKLDIENNLLDKVNIFRGKLNYDESIFNKVTSNDFEIKSPWASFEYNEDTCEFIILNLDALKTKEDVMTIILTTKESIPSIENTSISITNMESANWKTEELLTITNLEGNTVEEIILSKEHNDDKPIIIPDEPTTKSTTSKATTNKPTTSTKKNTTSSFTSKTTTTLKTSTTKKQELIIIQPTIKTTKRTNTTTKKVTTTKSTTKKKTKTTTTKKTSRTENSTKESTTKETTTKKDAKAFFQKNNKANKKVLIIFLVVLISLFILALMKYKRYKNINIFICLLITQILLASPFVYALSNLKGDIDLDGSITIKDITNLEKYLLNLDSIINDENKNIIDLKEDNEINTVDLAILIHLMLEPINDDSTNEEDPTAFDVINSIQIGWNLGNTLDSTNYQRQYLGEAKSVEYYETLWGNPVTTKEMIDKVKEAGFNSIRIPVTYYDHLIDGKIDEAWFKRVEEVVNYVLKNDLYCILDIHHDTGLYEGGSWIVADAGKFDENAEKVKLLWSQIAKRFKDYDHKLVFEGLNETVDTKRQGYDWNSGTEITLNVIKLNQVFVDTVRASGGKNKNRVLAVTTYGGITDEHKLSLFSMPKDIVENKIILAVHDYVDEEANIDKMIQRLKTYIVDKNIPIMIDEFGTKADKSEERRAEIAAYYVKSARSLNIPCFWWDDGGNYQLFNRRTLTWKYEHIKDALITASK